MSTKKKKNLLNEKLLRKKKKEIDNITSSLFVKKGERYQRQKYIAFCKTIYDKFVCSMLYYHPPT
jgi:hypothetical protein